MTDGWTDADGRRAGGRVLPLARCGNKGVAINDVVVGAAANSVGTESELLAGVLTCNGNYSLSRHNYPCSYVTWQRYRLNLFQIIASLSLFIYLKFLM